MMASPSTPNSSVVRIIIVDDDPIFRAGLRDWLRQYSTFDVVEDIGDWAIAFRRLQARLDVPPPPSQDQHQNTLASPVSTASPSSDLPHLLLILGGSPMAESPSYDQLIDLCQQIKTHYPTLAVLVLGTNDQTVIGSVQQTGVDGYLVKAEAAVQLHQTVDQVLAGQFQWPPVAPDEHPATQTSQPTTQPSPSPAVRVGLLVQLRFRWRILTLHQIQDQLDRLHPYVAAIRAKTNAASEWSVLDQWVILGRYRELCAAYWLVKRLLATPSLEYGDWVGEYRDDEAQLPATDATGDALPLPPGLLTRWQRQLGAIAQQPISPDKIRSSGRSTPPNSSLSALQTSGSAAVPPRPDGISAPLSPTSVRATLFDSLRERLQSPLLNQTERPLELDILREEKKRELLVLILHKLMTLLDDLRYSDVQPQQLVERRSQLFYDLWQSILTDYFGKYYVVQLDGLELEVVTILSQDARVVQRSIFDHIPFATDLLAHFLFQSPLEINGVPHGLGSPDAFERAELLLDNLVIQLGNSVVQPLLNHLADIELIKQNFYDYRCMPSRDIARFRNSLSWHYRRQQYVDQPTAIFESTYYLLTLQGMGIKQTTIYASRRQELDRLSGLPLVVTLLLELRDALSPRFREAIAAIGSAVIYVLTDVIGRGIGLIGRGILKGIGSAWQDPRNGL